MLMVLWGSVRIIHDFGPHRGIDGMTLAEDGSIVACTGWEVSGPGGNVTHFDPDGMIIEQHPVSAQRPTNCTFAGEDLYVSSIQGHCLDGSGHWFNGLFVVSAVIFLRVK